MSNLETTKTVSNISERIRPETNSPVWNEETKMNYAQITFTVPSMQETKVTELL